MKLTLIQVSSLDGTTNQGKGEDHHSWTSKEDQDMFYNELDKTPLVIMGSKTYEAAKDFMEHRDGRIRIIMTRNPERYKDKEIPGILEFTNEEPKTLIKRLESLGIKSGIHVGGASANTGFFKHHLFSDVWQTIEPIIVGEGLGSIVGISYIPLQLLSIEKLNDRGTLLLKYKVI